MGILDGGIQSLFGTAFGTFYLPALIIRVVVTPDGSGGVIEQTASIPCRVQQDAVTDQMRLNGGYSETDARFLILQLGVGPINSDDRLSFNDATYLLSNPSQDPGKSYWACRATPMGEE